MLTIYDTGSFLKTKYGRNTGTFFLYEYYTGGNTVKIRAFVKKMRVKATFVT